MLNEEFYKVIEKFNSELVNLVMRIFIFVFKGLELFKNIVFDILSFLFKKEFMINKLVNFDDKFENFVFWKISFKLVI